ncbi:hypothetical protein SEUCBS139899_005872 [Sporothrix eucalyptigena]
MPRPSGPSGPPNTADKMVAAELAFFSKALASFVKSNAKFEVVCSVSRRHVIPSTSSSASLPSPLVTPARQRSQIHNLVILDSSFNPPTLAHMKLAISALQHLRSTNTFSSFSPPTLKSTRLLLLLSVNNADKAPKPAPFEQRLALMLAMARDTHAVLASSTADAGLDIPIDIGLTSEPYFHNKSNAIAISPFYVRPDFASAPDSKTTPDQLFLLGYDTLIRIFDAKYYKASDGPIPESLPPTATPMQIALTPLMRRAHLRVTTRPDSDWGDETTQRAWVDATVDGLGGPTEHWASKISLDTGAGTGASAVSSTVAREASKAHDAARLSQLVGPSVLSWLERQNPYDEA